MTIVFLNYLFMAAPSMLPWVHSVKKRQRIKMSAPMAGLLALAAILISLPSIAIAAHAPIPSLPAEWNSSVKSGHYLLVDFMADYCGTCKMMAPHLKKMEKQYKDSISIKHINITRPSSKPEAYRFQISSTPTYILYGPDGQPVYRMIDLIAPTVLERQIRRAMGQLAPVTFPAGVTLPAPLKGHESSWGNLILFSFETPECNECQTLRPQLDAFAEAGQARGLTVIHIDVKKSPAWVANANLESYPTYILVDNSRQASKPPSYGELFRMSGETDPELLWQSIDMFSSSGLE